MMDFSYICCVFCLKMLLNVYIFWWFQMALLEKQYHQELEKEMQGMQDTPDLNADEIKNDGEEKTDDTPAPQPLINDDENMSMVSMSRKKRRLVEAMMVSLISSLILNKKICVVRRI